MKRYIFLMLFIIIFAPSTVLSDDGLPFSDDFETGDFSLWNGYIHQDTGLSVVSTGTPNGGSYHARATHTAASTHCDNYQEHFIGDYFTVGGDKVEEIWWQGSVKFSSGFSDWPSDNIKVLLFNLCDGTGARKYQVMVQADGDETPVQYRVQHSYIDTWTFNTLYQSDPDEITPGEWDTLKIHIVLNDSGISNGVIQFWVNGTLKINRDDLNIRESTSYGINKLILSSYVTADSLEDGYEYYDDFIFSASDIAQSPSSISRATVSRMAGSMK